MKELTRDELRALLIAWRGGQKTEREVHEEAEELMEACDWKDLPQADSRSIEYEVLCQLDVLNQQLITAEDIGAFLEFLATPAGAEEEAWVRWHAYWNQLDLDARRAALRGNPYYAV